MTKPLQIVPVLFLTACAFNASDESPAAPETRSENEVVLVANSLSFEELQEQAELPLVLASAIVESRRDGDIASETALGEVFTKALPPNSSLCTYYQNMAQYYSIRALQCAYSICYPMVPWYGYMAEYYNGLLEKYCTPSS